MDRYKKLILGSASPRRQELIRTIWFDEIEIVSSNMDEYFSEDIPKEYVAEFLSIEKSNNLFSHLKLESDILITADTVVLIDQQILNKPQDRNDAIRMLKMLSNNSHTVITGVTIRNLDTMHSFSEKTKVYFQNLTREQIEFYIDRFHPYDKAGSYGVQDFIGMMGVRRIEGCFYNVMGLPTSELYKRLVQLI